MSNGRIKLAVFAVTAAALLMAARPATAASAGSQPDALRETLEKQMLEFVRNNYPSRMNVAVRSMQSGEGLLNKRLSETIRFLEGFALGPVALEGRWEGTGRGAKYLIFSVIRGVQNYPKATVIFRTAPGLFRPFTVVQVDADGDGKIDEQSTAICRREKMVEWLAQRFPQAVCLARNK